jgi:xanthine dehydrogenase small subunit
VKTPLSQLEMRRARSLDDALEMMSAEQCMPIAGATDVYVALNFGTLAARRFVDIWALDELRGITVRDDVLVLGALTTYTAMLESSEVLERLPMMIDAARQVGGRQIQNRGTIGGNIANGSPAGDSLPVLAAADAVVALRSLSGERRVPLTAFYTGYRATVMRADELITSVEVPRVQGRQWFRKVGTRAAQAISKVVIAAVRDDSGARIAVGSVAPTVVRLSATEGALSGAPSSPDAQFDAAMAALRHEVHPIDDLRSTAEYRRRVTENLVRRFWSETS